MHITRISALIVAGTVALGLSACASDSGDGGAADDGSYMIGIANFTLDGPYFSGMDKAIKDEAEKQGAETISTDADGDAAKLASNVEDLISKSVDAVVISGGPLESAPAVLNSLAAANIPVVLVDRKFATGEYTSWIGPDNEQIGVQNGEYLESILPPDGGKVGIIKGGPADNSIGSRAPTASSRCSPRTRRSRSSKRPTSATGGGRTAAFRSWRASSRPPPDLVAVFCENDAMCLGAQRAIENAGLSDQIVLAAVDGQLEALEAIAKPSNYVVTGLNSADEIGRLGLNRALDILAGKEVEKDTVVPSPQITEDNAQEFIDKGGTF